MVHDVGFKSGQKVCRSVRTVKWLYGPYAVRENDLRIANTTSTPCRATNLIKLGEELFWEGSLECLNNFVKVDLNIEGKWTSPGGEVKVFTTKDHIIKWTGKSTRKLVVMKDDSKQSVSKKLERRVTLSEDRGAEAKDQNDMHHYELENANKNEIIDNFLIL
jgi:hypothetical protein